MQELQVLQSWNSKSTKKVWITVVDLIKLAWLSQFWPWRGSKTRFVHVSTDQVAVTDWVETSLLIWINIIPIIHILKSMIILPWILKAIPTLCSLLF